MSGSILAGKDKKDAKKVDKKAKKDKKDKEKDNEKSPSPLTISAPLPFPNPPRELASAAATTLAMKKMVEVHWPKDLTGLDDYSKKFIPEPNDTIGKLLQKVHLYSACYRC